jgi:hypothetical protein
MCYFILCFVFRVKYFLSSSQIDPCILKWAHKKWHLKNIACEMKFKDKTYGLNILVAH